MTCTKDCSPPFWGHALKNMQYAHNVRGTKPELVVSYPYFVTRLIPATIVCNSRLNPWRFHEAIFSFPFHGFSGGVSDELRGRQRSRAKNRYAGDAADRRCTQRSDCEI